MADVTLSYKGSDILELSDSGSATLKTGGTYCEADIEVEYVKPSGGGGSYIDLSDPSLWESKDFVSTSAVGTTYANTKTDTATRISLKQPIKLSDDTVFVYDSGQVYMTMYDENTNYIGWALSQWTDTPSKALVLSKIGFTKRTGNELLSSARYVGISMRLEITNPTITTEDAQTINARVFRSGVT